jgi:hypothetical protein
LKENLAMRRRARGAGATIERDGSESEAWLKLPPDSIASHLDELLVERAAQFDYRLKQHSHRPDTAPAAQEDEAADAGARAES